MNGSAIEHAIIWNPDARAENREREVSFDRERVIIARRFQGVRMRVNVPTRAYRGVVLTLDKTAAGGDLFRVSLWHGDRDFSVTLAEAPADGEIIATWKSWSAFFGLPKFVEREPGLLEGVDRRLGQLALGTVGAPRRRGAAMNARRCRRRLLRKMGAVVAQSK